uniref:Uncharacterized protein n=1 Tax=Rhizophora mucronata TaxID=61149 RepID=A0A2P2IWE8_RHIMU
MQQIIQQYVQELFTCFQNHKQNKLTINHNKYYNVTTSLEKISKG